MSTMAQQPKAAEQQGKKPYAPPRVRSEKILVPDLFTPSCVPDPETGAC
ncbi:hypothetical protein P2318_27425 [Myxococcaceae bacterium GXIMD 01537]